MNILACVAHPDDEILGVGGTLLRHVAAGDEVLAYVAGMCSTRSLTEQDHQMQESARRLGLHVQGGGPDLHERVRESRPDIVYTHSSADLHADHREVHERVLVATRPGSGVKAIYAFETPSATDWGVRPFTPTHFVDIGDTLAQKLHAMGAYESELRTYPHPRNLKALTVRSQYWGQRVGIAHAEAFEVIRSCW